MAVKEWFRKLRPVQLYIILFLTTAFFAVELAASYVSHGLTLLLNAYHMLCNIVALVGCIASIKYGNQSDASTKNSTNTLENSVTVLNQNDKGSSTSISGKSKQSRSDKRMKNTFGWARIDTLTMLACCVLLASFCFSILVEALSTLIHIDHLDEMHHPLPVMCIGASGILLNAFCYFLIGGYTFNQGVFLHFTSEGDVILRRNLNSQTEQEGEMRLSAQRRRIPISVPNSQGFREMLRDVLGCVIVMITSITIYFTKKDVAKFIDPAFAFVSAISLLLLSYPYMKESCLILLQTIPNHINIDYLKKELLAAFPGIVNVHDLHVWQLNGERVISTVHIIFLNPSICSTITDQVTAFFMEMGITHVTIQPEFLKIQPLKRDNDCLIRCRSEQCYASQCCNRDEFEKTTRSINKRFEKKEILPSPSGSSVDLKRFAINLSEDDSVVLSHETVQVAKQSTVRYSRDVHTVQVNDKCDHKNKVCAIDIDRIKCKSTSNAILSRSISDIPEEKSSVEITEINPQIATSSTNSVEPGSKSLTDVSAHQISITIDESENKMNESKSSTDIIDTKTLSTGTGSPTDITQTEVPVKNNESTSERVDDVPESKTRDNADHNESFNHDTTKKVSNETAYNSAEVVISTSVDVVSEPKQITEDDATAIDVSRDTSSN